MNRPPDAGPADRLLVEPSVSAPGESQLSDGTREAGQVDDGVRPTLRQRAAFLYRSGRLNTRVLLAHGLHSSFLAEQLSDPVFIVGSPRSGTTLVKELLGHHPDVSVFPGEANPLWHPQTYPWRHSRFRGEMPPFWADPLVHVRRSLELRSPRQGEHIRTVFGAFSLLTGGKLFLNKSALIMLMVPYVLSAYPTARFIHVTRDGRSVAFSHAKMAARRIGANRWLYAEHGFDLPFDNVLKMCALSWRQHVKAGADLRSGGSGLPEGRLLDVRYETFCESPEEELGRICTFVGVDPDGIPRPLPLLVSDRNWKVGRGIDSEAARSLDRLLESELSALGYA